MTITHTAGDTVAADELAVQGEGFVDASEADMTAAGEWAGTSGDDGSVAAGDSVVVGVRADCSLRVIWSGENVAATLDQFEGPEA